MLFFNGFSYWIQLRELAQSKREIFDLANSIWKFYLGVDQQESKQTCCSALGGWASSNYQNDTDLKNFEWENYIFFLAEKSNYSVREAEQTLSRFFYYNKWICLEYHLCRLIRQNYNLLDYTSLDWDLYK